MTQVPFRSTIYSSIVFHARFNPHSVAVSFGDVAITYRRFVDDVERVTRRLAAMDLGSPARAVVNVGHPYIHWLLSLALGRMGVATAAVFGNNPEAIRFLRADLVLTDLALEAIAGCQTVRVGADWMNGSPNDFPPFAEPEHGYDDPLRLVLSSGTTGTPKKIMVTYGQFNQRLRYSGLGGSISSASRSLCMVGADTMGGYQLPLTTWAYGGRVVLLMARDSAYVALRRHGVNVVFMAPIQLDALLKSMPKEAWPIEDLLVVTGGSVLPAGLAQQARLRLSSSLMVIYGSTEASSVYRIQVGAGHGLTGGWVVPEAEVQVVDAQGCVVPPGTVGEIRVRSAAAVTGYADETPEEAAASEAFRDGWFHPGDAGTLSEDGMLTIVGRTKELMNFGGVKVSPELVEQAVRDCEGVADIAAFSVDSLEGPEQPWVAVVRGEGFEPRNLAVKFRKNFPQLPDLRFAYFEAIPRNGMGKVLRGELQKAIKAKRPAPQLH